MAMLRVCQKRRNRVIVSVPRDAGTRQHPSTTAWAVVPLFGVAGSTQWQRTGPHWRGSLGDVASRQRADDIDARLVGFREFDG